MINASLQSIVETDYKKIHDSFVETLVEMNPSKLLKEVAEGIKAECDRLAPYAGFKPVADLSVEDIHKYFHTLVWMRCKHVADQVDKSYSLYRTVYKVCEVPTFIYQLMISIGEAIDSDYSIRFIPGYSIEDTNLLSVEQMKNISNVFLALKPLGFSSVTGMPSERSGELDFMACCHVKEVVRSYKDSHPVYGFLAAFFQQTELNSITGMMCRIIYGYDSDYEIAVRRIVSAVSAHQPASKTSD